MSTEVDVVVVGAGLAGLTAGRSLLRSGLEPLVVEAQDRVGGRVLDEPLGDGGVANLGGEWTNAAKPTLNALAAELGVGTFPTHDRGRHVLELRQRTLRYRGPVPPLPPPALVKLRRAMTTLDRMAATVPTAAPWRADMAARWDSQTLATMVAAVDDDSARASLELAVGSVWAAEPHRVNLLHALVLIRSIGSFDRLLATKHGYLQDRFVGGAQLLAHRLAGTLGPRVRLGLAVTSIRQTRSGVTVVAGNETLHARHVIVAVPPNLAARIDFQPSLPSEQATAMRQLPMGATTKVAAVYDEPFWRASGMSGRAATDLGPVSATFDTSPVGGSPGVLTGFVLGEKAHRLAALPDEQRRTAVLDSFSRLFGVRARRPIQYLEKDWQADPWSGGAYFGLAQPGAITGSLRTLAQPAGAVHFAGAETAWESFGGMDGAVRSGERAAREVRQARRRTGALTAV